MEEPAAQNQSKAAPEEPTRQWYVMRDLKRANAKEPAYKALSNLGFRVFTPMTTRIAVNAGKRERRQVPFIQDLLFVNATRAELDPVVARTETLQYRFLKGHAFGTAMTVPDADMERFIAAVSAVATPHYYTPDEITPDMYGARVRILGGSTLDGLEGILLKVKGARRRRLLLQLPGILAAAIEVGGAEIVEVG